MLECLYFLIYFLHVKCFELFKALYKCPYYYRKDFRSWSAPSFFYYLVGGDARMHSGGVPPTSSEGLVLKKIVLKRVFSERAPTSEILPYYYYYYYYYYPAYQAPTLCQLNRHRGRSTLCQLTLPGGRALSDLVLVLGIMNNVMVFQSLSRDSRVSVTERYNLDLSLDLAQNRSY